MSRQGRTGVLDLPFPTVVEHVGEVVEIADGEGRWLYVNPAFERIMGYHSREVLGRTPAETIRSGAHPTEFFENVWQTVRSGRIWSGEMTSRCKSGALVVQDTTIVPVLDEHGEVAKIVAIKRDVTARERATQEYRALAMAAGDAIIVCDYDSGRILNVNPAASEMFGYTVEEFRTLTGRRLLPTTSSSEADRISEQLAATGQGRRRIRMQAKSGKEFFADVRLSGFEVAGQRLYVAVLRDVTEAVEREEELARSYAALKDAQARAIHSEKLAALGMVSAGIAHEINNPAAFVSLNLTQLQERLAEVQHSGEGLSECRTLVAECIEGMDRIRTITSDLRAFARIEQEDVRPVDVNDAVEVACRIVGNEIRHRARLVRRLGEVPLVLGDKARVVSVLTNLLVNSAQAIVSGDAEHNRIEVETALDGDEVRIVISDSGCGIPEELEGRVFEPFTTTKPAGSGTGLGLALCADIVRKYGGRIDIDSEPNVGTRVTVWLPAARPEAAKPSPIAREVAASSGSASRRILIIDDDEMVLGALARALRAAGEVLTASSGHQALELMRQDPSFDAVICDLMLPTMDGPEIYERACRVAPQLTRRFVFCSGGAFTPRVRTFTASLDLPVLDKPVTATQLHAAIKRASKA